MIISLTLFFILYSLDQLTKYLAEVNLAIGQTKVLIPNFVNVTLLYNPGAAFGLGNNGGTLILAGISLIASIVLGYFLLKNNWKSRKLFSLGITLAFSGCVGNLYDRVLAGFHLFNRSGVVDMVSFEPLNWLSNLITHKSFAIFNLADSYLVIGVIVFAIDLIFIRKENSNGN